MSRTIPRSKRTRGELDREQIMATALSLIDREGLDRLTMRRLAEELGCGTMTVYSHITGREDLLTGLVALAIDHLDLSYVPGETWQECARRTVSSYRDLAHEHPGAFRLLAFADNDVDPVATYFERLLWLFQTAGLTEEAARAFLSVADGFASGFLLYESRAVLLHRQAMAVSDELRHEASHLADLHASEAFETGFEVVLRGIEATFPECAAPKTDGPV